MRVIAFVWMVAGLWQAAWQLPVTIRARQDVPVENSQPLGHQEVGRLYVSPKDKPFVIRKGDTFQMVAVGQEGGCRIRVEKREYEVSSCPWLDGFTDHQTSVFEVVGRR
jgi:hypothetical protein